MKFSCQEVQFINTEKIGFDGIYPGRNHKSLFKFLESIDPKNRAFFIFYTSALPKIAIFNRCEEPFKNRLRERGARVLGCRGLCTYGPLKLIDGINKNRPSKEDLENARKFIRKVVEIVARSCNSTNNIVDSLLMRV